LRDVGPALGADRRGNPHEAVTAPLATGCATIGPSLTFRPGHRALFKIGRVPARPALRDPNDRRRSAHGAGGAVLLRPVVHRGLHDAHRPARNATSAGVLARVVLDTRNMRAVSLTIDADSFHYYISK